MGVAGPGAHRPLVGQAAGCGAPLPQTLGAAGLYPSPYTKLRRERERGSGGCWRGGTETNHTVSVERKGLAPAAVQRAELVAAAA